MRSTAAGILLFIPFIFPPNNRSTETKRKKNAATHNILTLQTLSFDTHRLQAVEDTHRRTHLHLFSMKARGSRVASAAAAAALKSSSPSSLSSVSPPGASSAVKAVANATAGAAQFTGNYLNRAWTRRLILGSVLQRYNPNAPSAVSVKASTSTAPSEAASRNTIDSNNNSKSSDETAVDVAVLAAQRRLSDRWQLPAKPLDTVSEGRILRLLARYACCEGSLSDEALAELSAALLPLPGAPLPLANPRNVERLLEMVGYTAEPGDNLRRIAYTGALHYSSQAEAFMEPFLRDSLALDGGDAFDCLRSRSGGRGRPGYAIDSATTSEVDDAIGVSVDPSTGEETFTVYVSDATVYCPFDSQLEQVTARALTTTTYLPEGVYFMLPKPIVEAATLREDRPCRTFNVSFQIDTATGELKNYSVGVGWLDRLLRITYDQAQELLTENEKEGGATEKSTKEKRFPPPSWLNKDDAAALRRIHAAARLRFQRRIDRARANNRSAVSSSLPDPLIKVKGTRVVSLTDQVVCTQDARLAVAELMIAANEVCSRIAQSEGIAIPFRGTRPLSSDHEAAKLFSEPDGVTVVASLDTGFTFHAEEMQRAIRGLSGVTRAMYAHTPLYHAGLDTGFYAHSTSPLRRYADMLVHHQLKVWLWRKHGGTSLGLSKQQKKRGSHDNNSTPFAGLPIPEYAMAALCASISTRQEQAALLQDGSNRFWALTYMQQQQRRQTEHKQQQTYNDNRSNSNDGKKNKERTYVCLVGETRRIAGSPEYPRNSGSAAAALAALLPNRGRASLSRTVPLPQSSQPPLFVSEVYLPELQLAHRVFHSRGDIVRVGAVVECRVAALWPTQDVLELAVVGVAGGGDERALERLWLGGVVSGLDS